MTAKRDLTLATIVFEGDLRLALLQFLSVDRLVATDAFSDYIVVLNGADNASMREYLLREAEARGAGALVSRSRFIEATDLPRVPAGAGDGWGGQQVVKLALADVVDTAFYLMLDGKNHFVRPTDLSSFWSAEGEPLTFFEDTAGYWSKKALRALRFFDVYTPERAAHAMPTTTPYLFITAEVRSAMEAIEKRAGQALAPAMEKLMSTEFLLYYAYLCAAHAELPYEEGPVQFRTLFRRSPADPQKAMRWLREVTRLRLPVFGLHPARLEELSEELRTEITALWRRALLTENEDPDYFLSPAES